MKSDIKQMLLLMIYGKSAKSVQLPIMKFVCLSSVK